MLHSASTTGRNQRYVADLSYRAQLLDVVTAANAVTSHAVEHDLSAAAVLHFPYPSAHFSARLPCTVRISSELVGTITLLGKLAVDPNDHTLRPEPRAQCVDEARIRQRRR